MGAFKSAVITAKGQALLAKAVLNTADLEFTKISVSENKLTGDLASKTGIGTVKQSVKIASVKRTNNNSVKVSASINNSELTSGYYVRNIGLYAVDPDEGEILYSISVADESSATADWMPPFNGVGVSSLMIDLVTVVSNADKVVVEVDPTASATVAQIYDLQAQVDLHYEEFTPSKLSSGKNVEVNDSAELPLVGLKLYGASEQIVTTGKNLLTNTVTTQTINGITFKVNPDDTITVNGTATEDAYLTVGSFDIVKGQEYIISGCPKGGNGNKYFLYLPYNENEMVYDTGNATKFTGAETATKNVRIKVFKGVIMSNLTFKPMIRIASITDATYEPYTGGKPAPSIEYPQNIVSAGDSGNVTVTVCGKNLLHNRASTTTKNGVTFTVNEDGTVIVNGTATERVDLVICNVQTLSTLEVGKTYIINGCPAGGDPNTYRLQFYRISEIGDVVLDVGSDKTFTYTDSTRQGNVAITVMEGVTVDNLVFKPMIRLATIKDSTYEPYIEPKTLTSPTPNGLPAIPVTDTSLATYTDADGKMWCADEIDYERGVYVERCHRITADNITGSVSLNNTTMSPKYYQYTVATNVDIAKDATISNVLCNILEGVSPISATTAKNGVWLYRNNGKALIALILDKTIYPDVNAVTALLDNINIIFCDGAETETALTAEEIGAYKSLITHNPVTTVFTDSKAWMSMEYVNKTYDKALQSTLDKIISKKTANNLTTTEEGFVLDARMGKELADKFVKEIIQAHSNDTGGLFDTLNSYMHVYATRLGNVVMMYLSIDANSIDVTTEVVVGNLLKWKPILYTAVPLVHGVNNYSAVATVSHGKVILETTGKLKVHVSDKSAHFFATITYTTTDI